MVIFLGCAFALLEHFGLYIYVRTFEVQSTRPKEHPVRTEIRKADISGMTPLDALNCIARWQERLKEKTT